MISSEPLTRVEKDWQLVPNDTMILIEGDSDTGGIKNIRFRSI